MKHLGHLMLLSMIAGGLTGCASPRSYFTDRGLDAADIFTATVGYGCGGIKARVGPLQAVLFQNRDCAGLRGGHMFLGPINGGEAGLPFPLSTEWGPISAMEGFGVYGWNDPRQKGFDAGSPIPLFVIGSQPHYFTQVEVAAGLGGTIRLGLNLGELVDFLLGWMTIDIFKDDIAERHLTPESNQAPNDTARNLADPQH